MEYRCIYRLINNGLSFCCLGINHFGRSPNVVNEPIYTTVTHILVYKYQVHVVWEQEIHEHIGDSVELYNNNSFNKHNVLIKSMNDSTMYVENQVYARHTRSEQLTYIWSIETQFDVRTCNKYTGFPPFI